MAKDQIGDRFVMIEKKKKPYDISKRTRSIEDIESEAEDVEVVRASGPEEGEADKDEDG